MENRKHPHARKSDEAAQDSEIKKEADIDKDSGEENGTDVGAAGTAGGSDGTASQARGSDEMDELARQLTDKTKKADEYLNMLQRLAAEFDNYKKRTAKEKEMIASDMVCDVFSSFLPVLDNFEKAITAAKGEQSIKAVKDGVDLIYRQFKDTMKKYGLEEIKCLGKKFDPELHNAVMHVDDENAGDGVVVEELQKGYSLQDKVVRHSVVKVAN